MAWPEVLRPGHLQSARPGQFGDPGQGYAILCNNLRNFATLRSSPGQAGPGTHQLHHAQLRPLKTPHNTSLPRIWPLRQLWGYGLFNTHSQSIPGRSSTTWKCVKEKLLMWCNSPLEVSACRCLICHSQREDNKKKFVVTLLS